MSKVLQRIKGFFNSASVDNSFRLDGAVPLRHAIPNGLQHVLAMFVGNVAPILIIFAFVASKPGVSVSAEAINNGIRSAIFMAALGTLIQLYPLGGKIGAKLPLVVGASFTFLGVLTVIGYTYGLGTMFISIMIGGPIIILLGLFAHKWVKAIKPIVCAMVVIGLGLSLLSVGVKDFLGIGQPGVMVDNVFQFSAAWPYILVAFITLITCVLWQVFVKGIHQNLSILVGLVVGFIVACCFIPYNHMVDFSAFRFETVSDFINVPRPIFTVIPMQWSDFNIGAILIVLLIYIVSTVESIGSLNSLTSSVFGREPTPQEVRGMVTASGLSGALCGFFGCSPNAVYAQNVGILSQTKVVNRYSVLTGVIILFLASLFTPIATLLQCVPDCVLAGTMISLFGSIAVIGMQMFARAGFSKKNVLVASVSICLGFGLTVITEYTGSVGAYEYPILNYLVALTSSPVANMFVLSFILSYIIPDSFNDPPTEKKTDPE